ncbi:MAG: hypothetical protein Fur0034_19980 [Desulfuromonadia bacterium]
MLIELHAHTAEHSACSIIDARTLLREALQRGVDALILTDHHYCWPAVELERLRASLPLPPGFLLLSGQEVTTLDRGDFLVFGPTTPLPFGITLNELRDTAPDAALVWAHPFRWGEIPVASDFHDPRIDAVEIVNGNQTGNENMRGVDAWMRYRFTATAGSDSHSPGRVGRFTTQFDDRITSLHHLVTAIRGGRCRPAPGCIPPLS